MVLEIYDFRNMENNSQISQHKIIAKEIIFFIVDIVANAIVIISLVLVLRNFFIAPFQVYGSSMCNTLNYIWKTSYGEDGLLGRPDTYQTCEQGPGEYLIIDKASYGSLPVIGNKKPQKGDIIVFQEPKKKEEFYIKRIIGIPGDTVILEDGFVYLKNTTTKEAIKLDEELYLNDINFGNTKAFSNEFTEFVVPENSYFVLGDNRTASADSRRSFLEDKNDKNGFFIQKDLIVGKAWVVIWPLKSIRILEDVSYPNFD